MGFSLKKVFKDVVENAFNPVYWVTKPAETIGQWVNDIKDHPEHVAEREREAQQKAIDEQNAYNTPANQVQRLLDAGLNPNLFYNNVDTGNQRTTANYSVGDKGGMLGSILGYAFNALQLVNDIKSTNISSAAQIAQAEHSRDVLDFQRNQAAISNALRVQEMAFRQSSSDREYEKWLKNFDEQVRHHKALEGKSTTMGMLDSLVYGATGRHTTDILGEAGRAEKRYIGALVGTLAKPLAKAHAKYL